MIEKGTAIVLKKLENPEDAKHESPVAVNDTFEGYMEDQPEVGKCFYCGWIRTSTVQEIISPTKFRTYNSIYEIIPLYKKEEE